MTQDTDVLVEKQDHIATITLNRPKQRNAINAALCSRLRSAIDDVENDPDIRVAILCGNGSVFCAGMDLQAFSDGDSEEILFGKDRLGGLVSRQRSKPLIASVQGAALAGGFELVLACDMVVAAEGAVFGLPESKIGLIAGAGGVIRICDHLPKAVAHEMLLTGAPITAATAMDHGLVNSVVSGDELMFKTLDLAQRVAACAPLSVTTSLQLAAQTRHARESSLWLENDLALRQILDTADAKEGSLAFLNKRAPIWSGR